MTDRQTYRRLARADRLMDGHTDFQSETILPHHYRVVGYKKKNTINLSSAELAQTVVMLK